MPSDQKGHFATKHPPGTTVDPRIVPALMQHSSDLCITCVQAHSVAGALGVSPQEVGTAIDLHEGRILKCQLGLFGHGAAGKAKAVQAANTIIPEAQSAIQTAQDHKGRLTCAEVWRIADTLSMSRLAIANACEALGVKIIHCQLGAFS